MKIEYDGICANVLKDFLFLVFVVHSFKLLCAHQVDLFLTIYSAA